MSSPGIGPCQPSDMPCDRLSPRLKATIPPAGITPSALSPSPPRQGHRPVEMSINHALGLLELGAGRPEIAASHLAENLRLEESTGLGSPVVVPWKADYVEALVGAGQPEQARESLAKLEAQARATQSRWATGASQRCRTLIGDSDWEALGREAIATLHGLPIEQARAHLVLGEQLRRARRLREARIPPNGSQEDIHRICRARMGRAGGPRTARCRWPSQSHARHGIGLDQPRVTGLSSRGRWSQQQGDSSDSVSQPEDRRISPQESVRQARRQKSHPSRPTTCPPRNQPFKSHTLRYRDLGSPATPPG